MPSTTFCLFWRPAVSASFHKAAFSVSMLALTSFTRTDKADQQLAGMITMLHGRGTTVGIGASKPLD